MTTAGVAEIDLIRRTIDSFHSCESHSSSSSSPGAVVSLAIRLIHASRGHQLLIAAAVYLYSPLDFLRKLTPKVNEVLGSPSSVLPTLCPNEANSSSSYWDFANQLANRLPT